ncbi:MAG TPA: hypothetical protein PLB89_04780 [Flavobacteriales bacterium]|nr:hypothetical protein [Flavobacteriales bacterium]
MKRSILFCMTMAICSLSAFAGPLDADTGQTMDILGDIATGASAIVGTTLLLAAFGVRLRTGIFMSTAITTTLLNSAYGAQYRDNSKSQKDLMQQIYATATFDQLFKVEYTDLTVWEKAVSRSTAIVQPAQLGWTPNGEFSFVPSPIPTYAIKADLEFSSFSVEEGFVGFMHENNVSQTGQELIKYIMNNHVSQQFAEDVELQLAFNGVRVTPTPGTAGAVGTSINGVYTVINDAITATTITPIAVGAAPNTGTAYMQYIEEFVEGINFKDRRRPMKLAVSEAACSLFEVGMMATYNQNYNATENLRKVFRYKNIELVPQVAMGNSTKIFCTPAGNAIKPVNVGKGPLWQFETEDRKIKAWTNQRIGYGFWDHSRVYTNDVELTPAS